MRPRTSAYAVWTLPEALWTLPQVIVTPHSAGQSASHAARVAAMFATNLRHWLRGEPLVHAVA